MLKLDTDAKSTFNLINKFPKSAPSGTYLPLDKGRRFISLITGFVSGSTFSYFKKITHTDKKELGSELLIIINLLMSIQGKKLAFDLSEKQRELAIKLLSNPINEIIESPAKFSNAEKMCTAFRLAVLKSVNNCVSQTELEIENANFNFDSIEANRGRKLRSDFELACHDFAFYSVYEEGMFPYIFSSDINVWARLVEYRENHEKFLTNLGYIEVKSIRPGDLVIYSLTDEAGKKTRKHIGIYVGNNKFLSKFGQNSVYKHEVNQVPSEYGNCAQFYRKIRYFGVETQILSEIEKLTQVSESIEECLKILKREIIRIFDLKEKQIPKSCIYAVKNLIRYGNTLIDQINHIASKDKITKSDFLLQCKKYISLLVKAA